METQSRSPVLVHCETAKSNQFELLAGLVQRRYDERPARETIAPDRLRFSLGEMMRDSTIARIWIAYDGRKPVGYAIMTLGCSLRSGGRHAVLDECYLIPDVASAANYTRLLTAAESAADGLRLRRVFVAVGDHDADFGGVLVARGYEIDERTLYAQAPAAHAMRL